MLKGKAKTDYQRDYMRKRRKSVLQDAPGSTISVGPDALDLAVRPITQDDGIAPKVQRFNPMMVGYEPLRG